MNAFWDYVETCRQGLLPENQGWNYVTQQYLLISDYAYAREAAFLEDNKRRVKSALNAHQASWRPIRRWGWADHLNKLNQAYSEADSVLKNHFYYWPDKTLTLVENVPKRKTRPHPMGGQQQAGLAQAHQLQANVLGLQQPFSGLQGQQWRH